MKSTPQKRMTDPQAQAHNGMKLFLYNTKSYKNLILNEGKKFSKKKQ